MYFVASIHSFNAEKLFCLLRWSDQEAQPREKKVRIKEYLEKFMATAEDDENISKSDMSYSVVERYLLLIDWLQDAPAVIDAIRADYEKNGENCAFRLTTFYVGVFKELNPEYKLEITKNYLNSSPCWSAELFKRHCIAIPHRVAAAGYFEKAVVEATENKMDPITVQAVCIL